jgi:hypothetical protein
MSRADWQAWAEAYDKEYGGFKECAFKIVRPEKGIKIHDTLTKLEYKEDNGIFLKRRVRLCGREDQQVEGKSFKSSDLCSPTLKAPEERLLAATAAWLPIIED